MEVFHQWAVLQILLIPNLPLTIKQQMLQLLMNWVNIYTTIDNYTQYLKKIQFYYVPESLISSPDKAQKNNEWNPTTKRKSLTSSITEEASEQNGNKDSSGEDDISQNDAELDDNDEADLSDDPVSERNLKMAPLSSISEVTLNTIS